MAKRIQIRMTKQMLPYFPGDMAWFGEEQIAYIEKMEAGVRTGKEVDSDDPSPPTPEAVRTFATVTGKSGTAGMGGTAGSVPAVGLTLGAIREIEARSVVQLQDTEFPAGAPNGPSDPTEQKTGETQVTEPAKTEAPVKADASAKTIGDITKPAT